MPPGLLPTAAVLTLLFGVGPNFLLALSAVTALMLGSFLLWRPGEPPILLFIFAFQWIQASISVFHANWLGIEVARLAEISGQQERAIILSIIGLLVLGIGMRIGAGNRTPDASYFASAQAGSKPESVWFKLYALVFVASFVAQSGAWILPGLSQPMLAVAGLKWAFFWMLAYATFASAGSSKAYFLSAFAVELVLGVGGYFSDFKTVIFFTLFAAVAARVRVSPRALIGFILLGAMLVSFAVVWSAIKKDYRSFISGGERVQLVTVGYSERAAKLFELIGALDSEQLTKGTDTLLRRLTYVEYFGATLDYVPRFRPHEDGVLWLDAITRPFIPRLFFPGKTVIDDSERTSYYTGIDVYGMEKGTSISLGYIAEAYIDFGEIGMMAAVLLLGLFYGKIYQGFVKSPRSRGMLGMGLASAVLYSGALLESSITKVFGGMIVAWLVSWLMILFVIPRTFPWLQVRVLSAGR